MSEATPAGVSNASEAASSGRVTAPHRLKRYRTVFARLAPRLAEVGVNSWLCDADGGLLSAGVGQTAARPGSAPPAPEARQGSRSVVEGPVVWTPLGKGAADAWIQAVACNEPEAATAARVIEWSVRDGEKLYELGESTVQIGDRLAQVYELMHVVFRLARLTDGVENPAQGVTRVLDEVRAGLPFSWLAVCFVSHRRIRPELSGRFVLSGAGDVPASQIEGACRELLGAGPRSDGLQLILPGDATGLADRLGTELAAVPLRFEGERVAVVLAGEKVADRYADDAALSSFETQFLSACGDLLGVFHENMTRFAEQRELFTGTVRALTSSIDAKHRYTRGHSDRVALLAKMTATALGLGEAVAETYHLAGLLHDVGKIGVPEQILSKPGKLTDEEFAAIKLHPRVGYEILKGIPLLAEVLPGVLHHHEQFGGRGYPDGLAGTEIPLIARVLALCDTFDAMSSSRSYRSALSRETVLGEISKCAGRQFDPELAAVFVTLDFAPFDRMFVEHTEQLAAAA